MSAPVVSGTVALMLQANPSLTPNGVKAILQLHQAQFSRTFDPLTQGAGFLNAKGAVELARYLGSPATVPYPSSRRWSGRLIWGNQLLQGGRLSLDTNAWSTDLAWGSPTTAGGESVTWGVQCATAGCDAVSGPWRLADARAVNVVRDPRAAATIATPRGPVARSGARPTTGIPSCGAPPMKATRWYGERPTTMIRWCGARAAATHRANR